MPSVPIGPSTVAGYTVSTAAFIAAVLAFINGDHGPSTLGVIAAGVIGALAFVVTQVGRYRQATAAITASSPTVTPLEPAIGGIAGWTPAPPAPAPALELDDEDEPRDELDPRAELLPTTSSPPPDLGDAGDPALSLVAGGQA